MSAVSWEMAARFAAGPGSTSGGGSTLEGETAAAAIAAGGGAFGNPGAGRDGGGCSTGAAIGGVGCDCEPLDADAAVLAAVGVASKSERLRFRLSSRPGEICFTGIAFCVWPVDGTQPRQGTNMGTRIMMALWLPSPAEKVSFTAQVLIVNGDMN